MTMPRALLALATIASLTSAAAADFITATFDSASPSETVDILNDGVASSINTGRYNWTRTGGDALAPLGQFATFCIEVTQNIGFGASYTYDVIPLAGGPLPVTVETPMGLAKAGLIAGLWSAHYGSLVTSLDFAAFQVAVWEIVYDAALDLSSGTFTLTSNAPVGALAQTWLDAVVPADPDAIGLKALSSNDAQDQLVPAPATLALLGLGAFAARRRR